MENLIAQLETFVAEHNAYDISGVSASLDLTRVEHGAITLVINIREEEANQHDAVMAAVPNADGMFVDYDDTLVDGEYVGGPFAVTYLF